MAVVDIKAAYRAVPIFTDHRRYLGLKFQRHDFSMKFGYNFEIKRNSTNMFLYIPKIIDIFFNILSLLKVW